MNPYNENNLVEQTVVKLIQEMWGLIKSKDLFIIHLVGEKLLINE